MVDISQPQKMNPVLPDPMEAARRFSLRLKEYETRVANLMNDQARQFGAVHQHFLESRQQSLTELANLLQVDISSRLSSLPGIFAPTQPSMRELFSRQQLEQFATGDIEECLGPAYAVFRGRRSPRIPNGRLLLMSRVVGVEGHPGDLSSGAIVVEYDCPPDPWYLDRGISGGIPNAVVMEIALQPCGFLSAYLQTPLVNPQADLYFRNLDGQARFIADIHLPGRKITARARLVDTTLGAGMILQNYSYDLSVDGVIFYAGDASFGYFPEAALVSQAGLDGSPSRLPWINHERTNIRNSIRTPGKPASTPLETGFSELEILAAGGLYNQGYIYARKEIRPSDWFFSAHFYEDPVMPGSLGVEALYIAMRSLIPTIDPAMAEKVPFLPVCSEQNPMQWKYRGQVRPNNREMEFEVHLRQREERAHSIRFSGEGSAWVEGKRIYEIKNLALDYPVS